METNQAIDVRSVTRSPDSSPPKLGKGIYSCPICRSKHKNSKWRQEDPERIFCANGHKKIKMRWYKSLIDYLSMMHPLNEDYSKKAGLKLEG